MYKMRSVINKIFSGDFDESVHAEFVKFSRGVFDNRYLVEGKKQKDKFAIKTSSEFANFFVRNLLEKVSGTIKIKGIIVSTTNFESECDFEIENVKKYMGINQLVINTETSADKIITLMEKYPRAFYALSFSYGDYELKIKEKPPKSGKPGNKTKEDDGPKADFCSLKTTNEEIINDLFFDFQGFSEIRIKHILEIKDIELPKEYKTPEEMRERAKRKGIVKRFIEVDGRKDVKEKSFVA